MTSAGSAEFDFDITSSEVLPKFPTFWEPLQLLSKLVLLETSG